MGFTIATFNVKNLIGPDKVYYPFEYLTPEAYAWYLASYEAAQALVMEWVEGSAGSADPWTSPGPLVLVAVLTQYLTLTEHPVHRLKTLQEREPPWNTRFERSLPSELLTCGTSAPTWRSAPFGRR